MTLKHRAKFYETLYFFSKDEGGRNRKIIKLLNNWRKSIQKILLSVNVNFLWFY